MYDDGKEEEEHKQELITLITNFIDGHHTITSDEKILSCA